MVLPDVPATHFEGEAELAVIIGKRGANIKAADAMSYVFGYTNFIDGSARGLKPPGNTFYQMKSRDTFAPIGPYIVTADEIKDPHKLQVRLWNNGTLKQNFNTDDMAHKIPRCIEFVSSIHGLEPGDVLATGTNHRGLHAFQNGDKVELEIDGLGRLARRRARRPQAHLAARHAARMGDQGRQGRLRAAGDRPLRADAGLSLGQRSFQLVARMSRKRHPGFFSNGCSIRSAPLLFTDQTNNQRLAEHAMRKLSCWLSCLLLSLIVSAPTAWSQSEQKWS